MKEIHTRKNKANNIPRFGQIALAKGFVTADHLKKALSEQVYKDFLPKSVSPRRIGEILLEKGWIRTKHINVILKEQKEKGLHDEVREEISTEGKIEIARTAGIIIPGMIKKEVREILGSLQPRVWYTPRGQEVWYFKMSQQNIYFNDGKVEKIKYV